MPDTYTTPQTIVRITPNGLGSTLLTSQLSINYGVGIVEMPKTISTNYCITTGTGAFSVGPLNINAVVTVPDGSVWTIK